MFSPGRQRETWKFKRIPETDRWLDTLGFYRIHTARDPSCLFRAVSEMVYNNQKYFRMVRERCVDYMTTKSHLFEALVEGCFESYMRNLANPTSHGGIVEIKALSHLYRCDFVVINNAKRNTPILINNGYANTIHLLQIEEVNHFDIVYTKEYIAAASFCQSVVYEALYGQVFQLSDISYAVDKMLHENAPDRPSVDQNNNELKQSNNDHLKLTNLLYFNYRFNNMMFDDCQAYSAKDLFDLGIVPFPYKVAKALDPTIYRNVEYDVWNEMQREMKNGVYHGDNFTLRVGTKCLYKIDSNQEQPYHCYIQDIAPDQSQCLIFIEELCEKLLVNYKQLEVIPIDRNKALLPLRRFLNSSSRLNRKIAIGALNSNGRAVEVKSEHSCQNKRSILSPRSHIKMKPSWNETPLQVDTDLSGVYNPYQHFTVIPPGFGASFFDHMDDELYAPRTAKTNAVFAKRKRDNTAGRESNSNTEVHVLNR